MCRPNERTHKHHIIPKYMGGPDTPENLVEVTVTQHAMFLLLLVFLLTKKSGELTLLTA
jgi:hypothetical protein